MKSFAGKKVFITGGSKGIGRSIALQLAAQGADVAIAARGQDALDATVAELRQAAPSQSFLAVSVDVTEPASVRAAAAQVLETLGGLDLLVCNSGYAHPGYIQAIPEDAYARMMQVNYLGHVHTVRAFFEHFEAQKSGHVVLVSSMLGFMGLYGYAGYAASKFAIAGFAECLRQELGRHDVDVTLFYPPTTETPGLDKENEVKPPEVWALEADSGFNKTYTADQVATSLLTSIRKRRFEAVVGMDSAIIFWAKRYLPGVLRWISDRELVNAIAKVKS